MASPPIRIRIGASVDTSVERSFTSIERRAQRAQNAVIREQKRASKAEEQEAQKAAKAAEREAQRAARAKEREAQRAARAAEKAAEREARAAERAAERAARALEQARRKAEKELERKARAAERAAERQARAALRASRRAGEAFAQRTSHRTTRFLLPNAPIGSMALSYGRGLARSAGADTDFSAPLARTIEQEDLATKISNKAYRPGQAGPGGQRVNPDELKREARLVAREIGGDTTGVLEGLFAFTSQSGDLAAARSAMLDLAKLAKSQGADFEQTFFAAGKINNALEQQPEFMHDAAKRAREVSKIMNLLIAQTKIGSVEFENMGVQIPKISGLAGLFAGPTHRTLGQLATVLQVAEKGQAPNAATAGTQTSALVRELVKGPVVKRFAQYGVKVRNEDGGLRDIKDIIIDTLRASENESKRTGRAQPEVITDIVRNSRAFLPIFDFLDVFTKQGGGMAGVAAVEKLFQDFGKSIEPKQLEEDLEAVTNTTSARIAKFNTLLEDVADDLRATLLPSFEKAAPQLIKFAETVSAVTTWTVKNPRIAIATAIGASIARAGIESAFRAGIERMILGKNSANAANAGKIVGAAGQAMAAAGVGLAIAGITSITVERFVAKNADLQQAAREDSQSAFELEKKAQEAQEQGNYKEAEKLLAQATELRVSALEKLVEERDEGGVGRSIMEFVEWLRGNQADVDAQRAYENRRIEAQQQALEQTRDLLRDIRSQLANGIDVNNLPDAGGDIPGRVSQ